MTQLYFEDVKVDDELPSVEHTPTTEMASNFFRQDRQEAPRQSAFTDAAAAGRMGIGGGHSTLVPGPLKISWLTKFVSDWAGTDSQITSIRVALRRPDVAGKPLVLSGRVVDKRIEDGRSIVEVEAVTLADGQPSVRASVQVRLPSRG